MSKLKKIFSKPFLLVAFLFILVSPLVFQKSAFSACNGSDCFSTSYDINFVFEDSGRARVSQKVIFKNKFDTDRLKEYGLEIGSTRVSEVTATDRLGNLVVKVEKLEKSTVITATARELVIGSGKTAEITVNYAIDDLAIKRGKIWEVNLPKIQTPAEVEDYKLHLLVPSSFGPLHSITPNPTQTNQQNDKTIYDFDKTSKDANVSAAFGKTQQFEFEFKYRLKNSNVLNANGTIALPPDTNQQSLFYTKVDPAPKRIYRDKDGNYLADYQVKGRSVLEISVTGFATISDQTEQLQTIEPTKEADLSLYLKSDKYWDTENASIQKKAKELGSARNIYNFVVSTLKYNYKRLEQDVPERFGSIRALQEPSNAICTDFTDLFVALARAAGIPARELQGYAYTDNENTRPTKVAGIEAENILHAWPEYYDKEKQRWVAVDPTWGSTTGGVNYFDKLDTNHFVFVVHGGSSVWPVPAGGYKITGKETDDLKVEFGTQDASPKIDLDTSFDFGMVIGGLPSTAKLTVRNKTGQALLRPAFEISVQNGKFSSEPVFSESAILPFETKIYDIKLTTGSLITAQKQPFNVKIKGYQGQNEVEYTYNQNALVKPFFLTFNPVSILTLFGFLFLILLYPPVFNRLRKRFRRTPKFSPE